MVKLIWWRYNSCLERKFDSEKQAFAFAYHIHCDGSGYSEKLIREDGTVMEHEELFEAMLECATEED